MRFSLNAVTMALLAALLATGGATSAGAVGAGEITGRVYMGTSARAATAGEVVVSLREYVGNTRVPYAGGTVTTNATGEYLFTGLPASRFDVVFNYPGTEDFLVTTQYCCSRFAPAVVDITIPIAYSIAGHVDIDSLGNSTTAGQVRVGLRDSAGGGELGWTMTDASGNYEFPSLSVRTYALAFTVPSDTSYPTWFYRAGSAIGSRDYTQGTTFTPSADITGLNVVVGAGPTIRGSVHDSAGNPLMGYTVRALGLLINAGEGVNPFGPSFSATTGPDGSYVFRSLPLTYEYLIEAGAGTAYGLGRWHGNAFTDWTMTNISGGTSAAGIDIVLYFESSVTGTVSGPSVDALTDAGWSILMSYYDSFAGTWSQVANIAQRDPSGHYSFDRLLPGFYKFSLVVYLPCVLNPDGSCATPGTFEIVANTSPVEVFEDIDIEVNFTGIVLGSLTIGKLVKSSVPGSTQVYLVNGLKSLVRVNSVATATDAGISASVTAVPASTLALYEVQSVPLSNAVSCEGLSYVAASGRLWQVGQSVVAGWPKTELHTLACWFLPRAQYQPINGGLFLQSSTGSATYLITAVGEKRPISGRVAMARFSYPFAPIVLRVSNSFLSALPDGPQIGSYFGKRPLAGAQTPLAANETSSAQESEVPTSLLTVDERATCYSAYFQVLGMSLFAPLARAVALDHACHQELGVGVVPSG